VLLYHGTSATAADRMKAEGIKPRCELALKSQWQANPSRQDCVYLSSVYGGYYAMYLLAQSGAGSGKEVAVVEIDSSRVCRLGHSKPSERSRRRLLRRRSSSSPPGHTASAGSMPAWSWHPRPDGAAHHIRVITIFPNRNVARLILEQGPQLFLVE
jgi:hypothetical protein